MNLPKIQLPPIQTKYKILALTGITFLLFGSYYDKAFKPHSQKISELKTEIITLEDTLKVIKTVDYPAAATNDEVLRQIQQNKDKVQQKIKTNEERLLPRAEFSKLLEKIAQIANDSGLDIKSFEPNDFSQNEGYQTMMIQMEVTTSFANLLKFFNKTGELPILLKDMSINAEQRPKLAIDLKILIIAK
ncbi:MAG: type 4a pilus biogenesis protein PilO [Candidatus Omnitrophica bacterium]|nr:type 4a pilus biogenesis protein PilO [Candidatus Omnitrophota bacterium]